MIDSEGTQVYVNVKVKYHSRTGRLRRDQRQTALPKNKQ
ncbi:hypothetical protein SAMN05444352_11179 [Pseudomonas japonica]|uniref:Uncharacterized protein n=1 Tax=Pseudomonas japonica TaxID=256466 RepID=A0A239FZH5_9PSED|nr:hypothetical protein SAMN05444352_11179 [Pseudomonas japonica]